MENFFYSIEVKTYKVGEGETKGTIYICMYYVRITYLRISSLLKVKPRFTAVRLKSFAVSYLYLKLQGTP